MPESNGSVSAGIIVLDITRRFCSTFKNNSSIFVNMLLLTVVTKPLGLEHILLLVPAP